MNKCLDLTHSEFNFEVGRFRIGPGEPVFIIAEVGINHHGDVSLCARMIQEAAASGANAVKLQTINPDESYVVGTASYSEFQGKELGDRDMREMMSLSERLGMVLFSTPGDFSSLDLMTRLKMPAVKISSGLMTNIPLIAEAARRKFPVIISTGMGYENEIAQAVEVAKKNGSPGIALLKCTALYPSPDDTINLNGITSLKNRFDVPIGYSDHTLDELACLSAVALGATVIEKHFTLDKKRPGADHRISMEPLEFSHMVAQIRRLEKMHGTGRLLPSRAEEAVRSERHRCLVARAHISAGDVFSKENTALKRPLKGQVGLPPASYEDLLGRVAGRSINQDEPITKDAVSGGMES